MREGDQPYVCGACDTSSVYVGLYDSYACLTCDEWLESAPNCDYFPRDRPETPMDVEGLMETIE